MDREKCQKVKAATFILQQPRTTHTHTRRMAIVRQTSEKIPITRRTRSITSSTAVTQWVVTMKRAEQNRKDNELSEGREIGPGRSTQATQKIKKKPLARFTPTIPWVAGDTTMMMAAGGLGGRHQASWLSYSDTHATDPL